jgi:hypothetical protein
MRKSRVRISQAAPGTQRSRLTVVHALPFERDGERARTWVRRHRDEITSIPKMLVPVAADVAADVVARGGSVLLEPNEGILVVPQTIAHR